MTPYQLCKVGYFYFSDNPLPIVQGGFLILVMTPYQLYNLVITP